MRPEGVSVADYWANRGAAEAVLALWVSKRIRPMVTLHEAAAIAGIPRAAIDGAIARAQRRHGRPRKARSGTAHAKSKVKDEAPAGKKWCPAGEHYVALSGFSRDRAQKDGLCSWCRECRSHQRADQRIVA